MWTGLIWLRMLVSDRIQNLRYAQKATNIFSLIFAQHSALLQNVINFLPYTSILSLQEYCNLFPFNTLTVSVSTNSSLHIPLSPTCCTSSVNWRGSHNKREFISTVPVLMYSHVQIFLMSQQPLLAQGLLIIQASGSQSATSQSVGLLQTSDRSDAGTCT